MIFFLKLVMGVFGSFQFFFDNILKFPMEIKNIF